MVVKESKKILESASEKNNLGKSKAKNQYKNCTRKLSFPPKKAEVSKMLITPIYLFI